jgi:hypothetical protein
MPDVEKTWTYLHVKSPTAERRLISCIGDGRDKKEMSEINAYREDDPHEIKCILANFLAPFSGYLLIRLPRANPIAFRQRIWSQIWTLLSGR